MRNARDKVAPMTHHTTAEMALKEILDHAEACSGKHTHRTLYATMGIIKAKARNALSDYASLLMSNANSFVDIVFDGPPSHQSGRFVEVEDASGKSIRFGEWIRREDGYYVLRFTRADACNQLGDP